MSKTVNFHVAMIIVYSVMVGVLLGIALGMVIGRPGAKMEREYLAEVNRRLTTHLDLLQRESDAKTFVPHGYVAIVNKTDSTVSIPPDTPPSMAFRVSPGEALILKPEIFDRLWIRSAP